METKPAKFWFVWNPSGRIPRYQHWAKDAAVREAERLARQNPDDEFVVLESVASVRVPETPVTWREHVHTDDDRDLPF